MAAKGMMTGMLGVYLTAADLTNRGFIVSPTSRSARGADLLVTDQRCRNAWPVQVKTNRKAANFWLVDAHTDELTSDSHIYVFVNLKGDARPEYDVVPSAVVARNVSRRASKSGSVEEHRGLDDLPHVWQLTNHSRHQIKLILVEGPKRDD